jgi:hypothetical protein
VTVKHAGSSVGYGPGPSHTIVLFAQSATLPGGTPIFSSVTCPCCSAMKMLLYSATLGDRLSGFPQLTHLKNPL